MKKILLFCLLLLPLFTEAQVIITVAGTGSHSYGGDGGPATIAQLTNPTGVNLDDLGNLYICDQNKIRKVSPAVGGTIVTVAGSGTSGYSGDGWPATSAQFTAVSDVFIDHKGNIYLPDVGDHRLRKVNTLGIMSTVAGTGIAGYNGDGIPASSAQLNTPLAVALDDTGNIYISDRNNFRIRKIDTFGIIRTICGTGVAGFSPDGSYADTAKLNFISCIKIDKSGTIYIAENIRIRKIGTDGKLTTIAGNGVEGFTGDGGPATAAEISGAPLSIDSAGNVFIVDGLTDRVRKITTEGTIQTVAGGNGGGFSGDGGDPLLATLSSPSGVAVNKVGEIFIGDLGNARIRMVTNHSLQLGQLPTNKSGFCIFPNPTKRQFSILVTTRSVGNATVMIRDRKGAMLDELSIPANEPVSIETCHTPGVYIVTVLAGNEHYSERLVIE